MVDLLAVVSSAHQSSLLLPHRFRSLSPNQHLPSLLLRSSSGYFQTQGSRFGSLTCAIPFDPLPNRLSLSTKLLPTVARVGPGSNPPTFASSDSSSSASDLPEAPPIKPDSTGGNGRGGSGGSGGGGGEEKSEGGGGDGEEGKEKKGGGMSMSQKLTLGYAALVGVGGVMGYMKTGSQKSLAAGGLSALLLFYVYTALPARPAIASAVGLGVSAALLAAMGTRFKNSGKVFPAGVVALVSLVMTGGYLHGILRSLH